MTNQQKASRVLEQIPILRLAAERYQDDKLHVANELLEEVIDNLKEVLIGRSNE